MPRTHFTRVVRKSERRQFVRQEKELAEIALRREIVPAESPIDVEVDDAKAARRIRRKHNRRHKPARFRLRAD